MRDYHYFKLKSVGCLMLLFLCTGCGFGWEERAVRSGTVQGQLTSTTGQPIPMQPVLFDPIEVPGVAVFEDKGIQTGSQGNYAMELPAGLYDIRVHDPNTPDGWQRQRVTVVPGQVTRADFTIERSIPVPHLGQVPHCDEAIPAPTHALGTSLGDVRLGMSAAEVQAVLGEPRLDFSPPGVHRRWIFPDGTRVTFASVNATDVAQDIITPSATLGATAEGLSIGDTIEDFAQTYQGFSVCANSLYGFRITGNNTVRLGVSLNEDQRVIKLSLGSD